MEKLKGAFLAAAARGTDLRARLEILPASVAGLVGLLDVAVRDVEAIADHLNLLETLQRRELIPSKLIVDRRAERLVAEYGTVNLVGG